MSMVDNRQRRRLYQVSMAGAWFAIVVALLMGTLVGGRPPDVRPSSRLVRRSLPALALRTRSPQSHTPPATVDLRTRRLRSAAISLTHATRAAQYDGMMHNPRMTPLRKVGESYQKRVEIEEAAKASAALLQVGNGRVEAMIQALPHVGGKRPEDADPHPHLTLKLKDRDRTDPRFGGSSSTVGELHGTVCADGAPGGKDEHATFHVYTHTDPQTGELKVSARLRSR